MIFVSSRIALAAISWGEYGMITRCHKAIIGPSWIASGDEGCSVDWTSLPAEAMEEMRSNAGPHARSDDASASNLRSQPTKGDDSLKRYPVVRSGITKVSR